MRRMLREIQHAASVVGYIPPPCGLLLRKKKSPCEGWRAVYYPSLYRWVLPCPGHQAADRAADDQHAPHGNSASLCAPYIMNITSASRTRRSAVRNSARPTAVGRTETDSIRLSSTPRRQSASPKAAQDLSQCSMPGWAPFRVGLELQTGNHPQAGIP